MLRLLCSIMASCVISISSAQQLESQRVAPQDVAALSSVLSHLGVSRVCQNVMLESIDTEDRKNETASGAPSLGGFYDSLGVPISEQEYIRQAQYEQDTGMPAVRDRDDERRRQDLPLSIKVFSTDGCDGTHSQHITTPEICVGTEHGRSVLVESMSSRCKVTIYDNAACTQGAEVLVDGLGGAEGCYTWIDGFNSIIVHCTAELPL